MRLSREEIRNIPWEKHYRFSVSTDTMTDEMQIQGSIGSMIKFDTVEIGHLSDGSAIWRYSSNPADVFPGIPEAKQGERVCIIQANESEENLRGLAHEMDPEIFEIFMRLFRQH